MGLEPTRLTTHGPQPCLSTNFSTRVEKKPSGEESFCYFVTGSHAAQLLVIWLGLEPRTLSLKGRCSTN